MEELKGYKINLTHDGNLTVQSTEKLSPEELQPLIDSSRLNQKAYLQHEKAYLQHEKEVDKQHQIYTLLIASLLCLGLFSISFVTIRTVSRILKTSSIEVSKSC